MASIGSRRASGSSRGWKISAFSRRSSRTRTWCRMAIVPASSSSHTSPTSGTSTPRLWRSRPSRRCAQGQRRSCRRIGKRPPSSGWRTSSPGASPASSGGVTRFRRGMGRMARPSWPRAKTKPSATRSAITSSRRSFRRSRGARWRSIPPSAKASSPAMKTCSTPGSPRRYGRSRRSAGLMRRRRSSATIRPMRW